MIRSFSLCKVTSLNYYRTKFWIRRKDYRKGSACGEFCVISYPFPYNDVRYRTLFCLWWY